MALFSLLSITAFSLRANGFEKNSNPNERSRKRVKRLKRIISHPSSNKMDELSSELIDVSSESNIGDSSISIIRKTALEDKSNNPYSNEVDLTARYTFVFNEAGRNVSKSSNNIRSGIAANRVKCVQRGQGDLYAYNGSITVESSNPGATHWLANPAGVLFGGTVIGAADGAYLNPMEIYLTDKSPSGSFNCTAIGAVFNLNRNVKVKNELGQVWAGIRIQSTGIQPIENIISAIGKFSAGIDLSMKSLDFGANRAAISLKAGDRIYFNAKAEEFIDNNTFIRHDWAMTSGFGDYCEYDSLKKSWIVTISGIESISINKKCVIVNSLAVGKNIMISGRIYSGWKRMHGLEDNFSDFNTETVTVSELARRVKALETALHSGGGFNGFLSS